jgi:hypothetical protein
LIFATRKSFRKRRDGRFAGRAVTAYGPSTIDPSTHRIEQIVLWMDIIHPVDDLVAHARMARQDKGGSMALKQVDRRSFWSAYVNLRT